MVTPNSGSHFSKRITMEKQIPTQIRLLTLIFILIGKFFRYGNQHVFYHICGHRDSYDNPIEAEGVEVRESYCGPRITIY